MSLPKVVQLLGSRESLISVIVPAFNEAAALGPVLLRAHKVLQNLGVAHEVIVVDDGSTDQTAKVATVSGARLVTNNGNLGKGCALRRGFREAKGQVIVTIDADGENWPEEIPILLSPIMDVKEGADVVVGSRFMSRSIEPGVTSPVHLLGNKILNVTLYFLTKTRITDSQSGFRAFKRAALQNLALESRGYEIEAEMVVKMLRKGFTLKEVPITYNKRTSGCSKLRTFKDGFKILKTIIKVFFNS